MAALRGGAGLRADGSLRAGRAAAARDPQRHEDQQRALDEETRKALVVIDLDTVMPGLVGHDFGDAIRFAANFVEEDSPRADKAGVNLERLMRSRPPLIIIASSTLGQGVNVGISSIIVSTPYYGQNCISNRDFWNICGRAGRAFSDVEGKILYAIDTTEEAWKVSKNRNLARNYLITDRWKESKVVYL